MRTLLVLAAVVTVLAVPAGAQEVDYARYVESVQVLVDGLAGTVSASVVLQSTGSADITLPGFLVQDIREHDRVIAALFTNADTCVPGVRNEACIVVNMVRIPEETNIVLVQDGAREVGNGFIDALNGALGTEASFHSVFVHHDDTQREALGMPGTVMGRNTVSAVYTLPQQDTVAFYDMLSSRVLASGIAGGGGFADAARDLAAHQDSSITLAAMPLGVDTLIQLKVTRTYNHTLPDGVMDPLAMLGIDSLEKSAYFGDGFYPLNSLVRVAVTSPEPVSISDTRAPVLPVIQSDGGRIPEDVSGAGWFFDPDSGTLIRGTYLFGEAAAVRAGETEITLGDEPADDDGGDNAGTDPDAPGGGMAEDDEAISADGLVVVAVIVAAGGAAAIFYLRGYGRR